MLWTPYNDFQWSVDNFTANYAQLGVAVAAAGSANTKGSDVEILSDTVVTEDVYGVLIGMYLGSGTASNRNCLVDIKTDPTGGTSYSTVISNLFFRAASINVFNLCAYYFPLYMKAGTAVAAALQCATASISPRLVIRCFGKPSRPELVKCGSKVESFGPDTATSGGAAITPGNSAMGSYTASLGTTAGDLWWWQGGLGISDTTLVAGNYFLDIAAGDASNKRLCLQHCCFEVNSDEAGHKEAFGMVPPYQYIPSGSLVYARAGTGSSFGNTGVTVAAYGLGG